MPPRTVTSVAIATVRRERTAEARAAVIARLLDEDLPPARTELMLERSDVVAELRGDGKTWEEIGYLFGVTKQRAQQYATPPKP